MASTIDKSPTHQLPALDSYWNPGEQTIQERNKLRMLHTAATAGGVLGNVLGRLAKSTVGILTYHRISSAVDGVPFPTINVTPETFRKQLTGLQQAGFQFASISSVLNTCAAIANGDTIEAALPERTVVVTFDDIYNNVFLNAWPVLRELQIPATLFVSTGFIDSTRPFLFDPWATKHIARIPENAWRPVTDTNLRTMLESGMAELGAHTHTHQDFRDRTEAFAVDVAISVQQLTRRYDVSRLPFAFPYGSPRLGFTSPSLMNCIKDLGLTCGLTTGSHTNTTGSSPFGWGRFHVFEHDTARSLAAKLDGWYEWLPKLKNTICRHR